MPQQAANPGMPTRPNLQGGMGSSWNMTGQPLAPGGRPHPWGGPLPVGQGGGGPNGADPFMLLQNLAQSMGQGVPRGPNAGDGPRKAGYKASGKTPMDQIYRKNPVNPELPKWMGRG